MKTKTTIRIWSLRTAITVLGFAVVGSFVFAASNGILTVTNNFFDNSYADQRIVDDAVSEVAEDDSSDLMGIGEGQGIRYEQSYVWAEYGFFADEEDGFNIGTFNKRDADNYTPYLTDGYSQRLVTLTITDTSSAGVINPEGETIYVYDFSYRIQTATTVPSHVTAGTSTFAGVNPEVAAANWDSDVSSEGTQSIFFLTTTFVANAGPASDSGNATGTVFMLDNPPLDTRDASGTRYVIPVLSTEYIVCTASSTIKSPTTTMGTYGGQCQFKYYVIED